MGVMGDSQAALFAQRCFTKGSTKVTLGTGSSMLYNIGTVGTFSKNGVVTTLASVIQGTPTYCFEGIIRFSSATMDWLKNQLGLFDTIEDADEIAASLEDSGGVFVVPAFTGLGAPYWNSGVRAAILGLTPHSNRAHIIRAGFESMGFQVRDVLEMMEREVESHCECLHVDGGPTRSAFLMQLLADILQRPIAVSSVAECSALGAVMAGLIGSGAFASIDALGAMPRNEIAYHPNADRARMDALYSQWRCELLYLNHQ
jgi:glycerol kinase